MKAIHDAGENAIQAIQACYEHFNSSLFGDVLPECDVSLQIDIDSRLGFSPGAPTNGLRDRIVLHLGFFVWVAPATAMQSLVHEMLHLWQFHFGSPAPKKSHNLEFAAKSAFIGLRTSATGVKGGAATGPVMIDYAVAGGPFALAVPRAAVGWETLLLHENLLPK